MLCVLAAVALAAQGTIDVRAFGAKGDGAADDTAAVQRAADAVKRAGSGMVASTYTMTVNDDSVLEADVSKLNPSARGKPIALVVSKKAISMSETALAAANAKGAAAKKPYRFSLSADGKTLYLTAESRGFVLSFR